MPYPCPSITQGRQVPPFVLQSGRRPAGVVFLPWLLVLVVLLPWCRTGAGSGRGGGAVLCGLPRFNKQAWPQAIHLSGGGADRRLGEPRRGAPVADRFAALRFFAGGRVIPGFWLSNYRYFYRNKN